MTRFLTAALGAKEPTFSQSIRQLEQAAGQPNTDIHLTSEVAQRVRAKIAELGLDPVDTTGPELYQALHERLLHDEAIVRYRLGIAVDAPAATVTTRVQQFLQKHDMPKQCFALKTAVAKKLLRAKPPKTAMKRLGYRSLDSMLKHESPARLYAAAAMCESPAWHRAFHGQYAKLSPSDFESRQITLVHTPSTERWQTVVHDFVSKAHHNMLGFRELGTVVALPFEHELDGLATTLILLISEEINAIRAHSSFVKLQQVKPQFGRIVQQTINAEPLTSATLGGQAVPWRVIQRYYASFTDAYHPELFEPHVQPEDLQWYPGEKVLAGLEPSLRFWQDTTMLALMHQDEPVSLNLLDVALSRANHLAFGDRIVHFFRDNLWHELMMRYLHQENLETAVQDQLADELSSDKTNQEVLAS